MGDEASQRWSRRDLMRRGALLGGALAWTTPVIQSLAPVAYAGSPGGEGSCPPDAVPTRFKFQVIDGQPVLEYPPPQQSPNMGKCGPWAEWANAGQDGISSHVLGVTLSSNGRTMTIVFDPSCGVIGADYLVKSGSKQGLCLEDGDEGLTVTQSVNSVTVSLTSQAISFVAIITCCILLSDHQV